MNKRIMAWVLLIGFIILLSNLIIFHYFWQQSLIVYIAIAAYFLIFMNRQPNKTGKNNDNGNIHN